jgi:hypothetical protein
MTTNNSSKRPATTLRCGNIEATIWQNVSEKGPFFATTFSRPFKDQPVPGARHLVRSQRPEGTPECCR